MLIKIMCKKSNITKENILKWLYNFILNFTDL